MAERLRFHLDEHIDPDIARALRSRGVDVTTTVEASLRSSSDEVQLAFVLEQRRVLVTHDDDFLRLHSQGARHYGIAYCAKDTFTMGEIIRYLLLMYEVLNSDDMLGQVEYIRKVTSNGLTAMN
jgi:hypothetical protein